MLPHSSSLPERRPQKPSAQQGSNERNGRNKLGFDRQVENHESELRESMLAAQKLQAACSRLPRK